MAAARKRSSLSALLLCAAVATANVNRYVYGQCQIDDLIGSDTSAGDNFGFSVAISKNVAVVGAIRNDSQEADAGAAYVYRHDGMNWVEEAKLDAADGATGDQFGHSVAVHGNTILVGARHDDEKTGAVYVFVFDGVGWVKQQKLTALDTAVDDRFGHSVSVDGNFLVASAHRDDDDGESSGSAYLFRRDDNGTPLDPIDDQWLEAAKLTASDATPDAQFGYSVSISGNTVLVGAFRDDEGGDQSGAAYIFEQPAGGWLDMTQTAKLTASDAAAGDFLGSRVAIHGDTAVIGALRDDAACPVVDVSDTGSAYVFRKPSTGWTDREEDAKLRAPDCTVGDLFGASVAIYENTCVVGAIRDDDLASSSGSAYVFQFDGSSWVLSEKFIPTDPVDPMNPPFDAQFGTSVATNGRVALVGALLHDQDASTENSGAAYLFSIAALSDPVPLDFGAIAEGVDLGHAVAMDGDLAVVSAPEDEEENSNPGAVYVFRRIGSVWTLESRLLGSDASFGADFGTSVAIDGDSIVVGAIGPGGMYPGRGAAYVFRHDGFTWVEEDKLTASDAQPGDRFGRSVSISGDKIVVGAPLEDEAGASAGAAYFFRRSGNTWIQQAKGIGIGIGPHRQFGWGVSISDDLAVVVAQGGDGHVFRFNGAIWVEEAVLTTSDGDGIQKAVSLDGDAVIVGARSADHSGLGNAGAAYIFVYEDGTWSQQAKLIAPDAAQSDEFGYSVGLSGNTAVVGALGDDGPYNFNGSAYFFAFDGRAWGYRAKITPPDSHPADQFSFSVGISGDAAIVGAPEPDFIESAYVLQGIDRISAVSLTVEAISGTDLLGVSIDVAPPDVDCATNGMTEFERRFNLDAIVSLVAPGVVGNHRFLCWLVDGAQFPIGQTNVTFPMYSDRTAHATYETQPPLSFVSIDRYFDPCYPHGQVLLSAHEVTNEQYVRFLNLAEDDAVQKDGARVERSIASTFLVFGPDGTVTLEDGAVLVLTNAVAPSASISYDPTQGVRQRYSVRPGFETHPVVHVSWLGAAKFCNWLTNDESNPPYLEGPGAGDWAQSFEYPVDPNLQKAGFRLPSSDEWYVAAAHAPGSAPGYPRIGPGGEHVAADYWTYGFGRDAIDEADANYLDSGDPFEPSTCNCGAPDPCSCTPCGPSTGACCPAGPGPTPVGFFDGSFYSNCSFQSRGNGNTWGAFDLTGNVREWTDRSVDEASIRGGGWRTALTELGAAMQPVVSARDYHSDDLGFRVLRLREGCGQNIRFDCFGENGRDQRTNCCDFLGLNQSLFELGENECADRTYRADGFTDYFDLNILYDYRPDECDGSCPGSCPSLCPEATAPEALGAPMPNSLLPGSLLILKMNDAYGSIVSGFDPSTGSFVQSFDQGAGSRAAMAAEDPHGRVYVLRYADGRVFQLTNDVSLGRLISVELRVQPFGTSDDEDLLPTDVAVRQVQDDLTELYITLDYQRSLDPNKVGRVRRYTFNPNFDVTQPPAEIVPVHVPFELAGNEEDVRCVLDAGVAGTCRWTREIEVDRLGYVYLAAEGAGTRLLVFAPSGQLIRELDISAITGVADFRTTGLTMSPQQDYVLLASMTGAGVFRFEIARDQAGVPAVGATAASYHFAPDVVSNIVDLSIDSLDETVWVVGDQDGTVIAGLDFQNGAVSAYHRTASVRVPMGCLLYRSVVDLPTLLSVCPDLSDAHADDYVWPASSASAAAAGGMTTVDILLDQDGLQLITSCVAGQSGSGPTSAIFAPAGSPGLYTVTLDDALPLGEWTIVELSVQTAAGAIADICFQLGWLPGDCNGDGQTSLADATKFGTQFGTLQELKRGDLNLDGQMSLADATKFGQIWTGESEEGDPRDGLGWAGKSLGIKPECNCP